MKKRLLMFSLSLVFFSSIHASSISSDKASYDGNALILSGKVQLEHALGKMISGAARLIREEGDGAISSIHLREDVNIALKKCGTIDCGMADFDFTTMTGKLLPNNNQMIRFINLTKGPLSLFSSSADIEFKKELNEVFVSKIIAKDHVDITYGKDFSLHADEAIFFNEPAPIVEASPHCILNHFEDRIEAEAAVIHPERSKLILSTPKGRLKPSAFSDSEGVDFSCNKLIWERQPHTLILQGDIHVYDEGIGMIQCDDEVELKQKHLSGKWIISNILAKGKTILNYHQVDQLDHTLICYGEMTIDGDRYILTMDSLDRDPIEYYRDEMKLSAEMAQLDYLQTHHEINPERLLLTGNVLLCGVHDNSRCGIADQVVYHPSEKKTIFSSKGNDKVLFWDEDRQLSISAKEVHIEQTEKGEHIKGVGNVRFAFSSTENALLQKMFPFYQPQGASR